MCEQSDDCQSIFDADIQSALLVCRNCGYIQDEQGNVIDEGAPEIHRKKLNRESI